MSFTQNDPVNIGVRQNARGFTESVSEQYTESEAAKHHVAHRFNNPSRFAPLTTFFAWKRQRLPTPGAQNYAFVSYGLPEFAIPGPGYAPRGELRTLQGMQSYQPTNAVPVNGLGGVVAGQVILQPLYDPNTNTFGGVPIPA